MRGGDNDQHAGLANLEPSKPVDDRDLSHLVVRKHLLRQRVHLIQRHRLVGFIIQKQCPAIPCVVTDNAFKDHHRAVLALLYPFDDPLGLNSLTNDLTLITLFAHNSFGSATDWREQRDFIAFPQPVSRRRVLLVHRKSQRMEELSFLGRKFAVMIEQVGNRSTRGQIE